MPSCENARYFDRTRRDARTERGAQSAFDESLLGARGFDPQGNRLGGITTPTQVIVPRGAVLIRTYGGPKATPDGQWWFTVCELQTLLSYAGHDDLAQGRSQGRGLLHAFLAVLRVEWESTCEFYAVVALRRPLYAFHGEGDHALYAASGGQKAALMRVNGRQRGMRQLFLPRLWEYRAALTWRVVRGNVDRGLVAEFGRAPVPRLPFEL